MLAAVASTAGEMTVAFSGLVTVGAALEAVPIAAAGRTRISGSGATIEAVAALPAVTRTSGTGGVRLAVALAAGEMTVVAEATETTGGVVDAVALAAPGSTRISGSAAGAAAVAFATAVTEIAGVGTPLAAVASAAGAETAIETTGATRDAVAEDAVGPTVMSTPESTRDAVATATAVTAIVGTGGVWLAVETETAVTVIVGTGGVRLAVALATAAMTVEAVGVIAPKRRECGRKPLLSRATAQASTNARHDSTPGARFAVAAEDPDSESRRRR